ncbi:MAG TPA: lysin, partial [Ruminococcaceae bacterium]|nr:lysin [Oscillospiraceae bacterium]
KATEGVDYVDDKFTAHASAALAAGLPIGAYHFLRAGDAAAQADDFLEAIRPYSITYPVACDVENKPGTTELSGMGR